MGLTADSSDIPVSFGQLSEILIIQRQCRPLSVAAGAIVSRNCMSLVEDYSSRQ